MSKVERDNIDEVVSKDTDLATSGRIPDETIVDGENVAKNTEEISSDNKTTDGVENSEETPSKPDYEEAISFEVPIVPKAKQNLASPAKDSPIGTRV